MTHWMRRKKKTTNKPHFGGTHQSLRASFRGAIGYGDIVSDPMAHGKTVNPDSSATPELGDSVVSTAAVAVLCVATLAGVTIADKKRREMAK